MLCRGGLAVVGSRGVEQAVPMLSGGARGVALDAALQAGGTIVAVYVAASAAQEPTRFE